MSFAAFHFCGMRRFLSVLGCFVAWSLGLQGQSSAFFAGARAVGMGRASVVLDGGIWVANPAFGLGEGGGFAACQLAMPYGLSDLSVRVLGLGLGSHREFWRLGFLSSGVLRHKQSRWMLAYGRSLQEHWAAGLRLSHVRERYVGFGVRSGIDLEVGIRWMPEEEWTFACLWRPYVDGGFRPASLGLGVLRRFEDFLLLSFELFQSHDDFLPSWRMGLEYQPVEELAFRLGLSRSARTELVGQSALLRLHGGLGYVLGLWQVDVALEYHPYLGFSPVLGVKRRMR